jgi:hypothetical protein
VRGGYGGRVTELIEVRRTARRHPFVCDGVLAVTVYGLALVASLMAHGYDEGPLSVPTASVGALISGALVFRRRWPWAVLAVTTGGTALYLALGGVRGPLMLVTVPSSGLPSPTACTSFNAGEALPRAW